MPPRRSHRPVVRLTTSTRLTARAEHDRCARALADTVGRWLVLPTSTNVRRMQDALREFTNARKVLDG